MRILLFLSIWILTFSQSLTAQTAQNIWVEMEQFITDHLDDPAPNEREMAEAYKVDLLGEGQLIAGDEKLIEIVRKSYWGEVFRRDNQEQFLKEKENRGSDANLGSGASPLNNPDLEENCELDIVVIIDRSGSIQGDEITNIRNGLLALVQNQIGTGNTLTFVGMGNSNSEDPISSVTVTYNPGFPFFHNNWINNTLSFGGSCDQCDSWSSGLEEASGNNADLVLIITDGNDNHGVGEDALTIAAANALKSNGENNGNGAHLFVLGLSNGSYTMANSAGTGTINVSLMTAVGNLIAPGPSQASAPLTLNNISTTDYIPLADNFSTINSLLSGLELCCEESVEVGWISNRECLMWSIYMSGNYEVCTGASLVGINLQFWNGSTLFATVPVNVNNDGTWDFNSSRQEMEALGINPDLWYDVVPVMVFADGTTFAGDDYISGSNDDVYFPVYADPSFFFNDSPTDWNNAMNSFCTGTPIYYHGFDPVTGASADHYPQIKRRPIGSTNYGDWQGYGSVGAPLDGYTGNLNDLFPGYFMEGYEYIVTIGSHDFDNCVAWSNVSLEFEIVPCCEPDVFIAHVPDCVENGETFQVIVELVAPLSADDIETIYSSYNNYTYISHYVNELNGSLLLFITFQANTCSCEGEALVFDIRLVDCPGIIWVMTDPIPCCVQECKKVSIEDWYAEECILVNGKPARYFCLEVVSQEPIYDAFPTEPASVTCETDIIDLEITQVGTGSEYTICGYMLFTDPDCTFHAEVNLSLQMENACCGIVQNFSFPKGCVIEEPCLELDPEVSNIQGSIISISIAVPQGEVLTVIDHLGQTTNSYTVGEILCGPYTATPDGGIGGGVPCNGFTINYGSIIDCRSSDDTEVSLPYHYEVQWGGCSWTIIGDYCNEPIFSDGGIDTGSPRSAATEATPSAALNSIKVFPNPLDHSGQLNFDLSALSTPVAKIHVTDISGKIIESFIPTPDQDHFQHQLESPLSAGIYFLVFHLADGQISSTKIVAIE